MARPVKFKIVETAGTAKTQTGRPDPDIGKAVLLAAANVHTALGPGMERAAYGRAMQKTLEDAGYKVKHGVPVSVRFGKEEIGPAFYIDILVEDSVMIVLSTERDPEIRKMVLRNYMRVSGRDFGFMICFNVPDIRNGVIQASRRSDAAAQADSSIN